MSYAVPKRCELEAEVLGKVTKGFSQARVKSPKTLRASLKGDTEVVEEVIIDDIAQGHEHIVVAGDEDNSMKNDTAGEVYIFDDSEVEPAGELIHHAHPTGDENGGTEQLVVARKRGRPRSDSETSSPVKSNKPIESSSPARKSSRISTR